MRICVSGGKGRLAQAICRLANSDPEIHSYVALTREDDTGANFLKVMSGYDVLLIFCNDHEAVGPQALAAAQMNIDVVVGTTALDEYDLHCLEEAAAEVTVAWSSNFDPAAQHFFHLVQYTLLHLKAQGCECSVEVFEVHPTRKKDAPSATAYRIAEAICRGAGFDHDAIIVGNQIEVNPGQVKIGFERRDDVQPFHEVRIQIKGGGKIVHRYESPDPIVYARNALRVAKLLKSEGKPGLYELDLHTDLTRLPLPVVTS